MSKDSVRLGGVYYDPDREEDPTAEDARSVFLSVIEQRPKACKCLVNLHQEVLLVYDEHGPGKLIGPAQLKSFPLLQDAVTQWARRFHLCAMR